MYYSSHQKSFLLQLLWGFLVWSARLTGLHLFWPDHICLQILLLQYSSASLYPSVPRFQNSYHHHHFHRSLKAWLLQLSHHNLPKSQITRLKQIQNSLAHAVVKTPKSSHITPILRSLHWLKITERIEYKLLSLTYKVPTTTQPPYLHNLITVQPHRSSSSLVTLARPSTSSSLQITDRSFQYASPRLWNQLTTFLYQPRTDLPNFDSASSLSGTSLIGSIDSPLSSSITPSFFHYRLKTFLFCRSFPTHRSLPVLLQDWLHGIFGLFTDTSENIRFRYFLVFLLSTF